MMRLSIPCPCTSSCCIGAVNSWLLLGSSQGEVHGYRIRMSKADSDDCVEVSLRGDNSESVRVSNNGIDCLVGSPFHNAVACCSEATMIHILERQRGVPWQVQRSLALPEGCEYTNRSSAHCWISENDFLVGCFSGAVVWCDLEAGSARVIAQEDAPVIQITFSLQCSTAAVSTLRRSCLMKVSYSGTSLEACPLIQIGTKAREEGCFGACYSGATQRVYSARHNNRVFEADVDSGAVYKTFKVTEDSPLGLLRPLTFPGLAQEDCALWSESPQFCAVIVLSNNSECVWRCDANADAGESFLGYASAGGHQFVLSSSDLIIIAPFAAEDGIAEPSVEAKQDTPQVHASEPVESNTEKFTADTASSSQAADEVQPVAAASSTPAQATEEHVTVPCEGEVSPTDLPQSSSVPVVEVDGQPIVKQVRRKVSIVKKVSIIKKKVLRGPAEGAPAKEGNDDSSTEVAAPSPTAEPSMAASSCERTALDSDKSEPQDDTHLLSSNSTVAPDHTVHEDLSHVATSTLTNSVDIPAAVPVADRHEALESTLSRSPEFLPQPQEQLAIPEPEPIVEMVAEDMLHFKDIVTRLYRTYCARQLDKKAQPDLLREVLNILPQVNARLEDQTESPRRHPVVVQAALKYFHSDEAGTLQILCRVGLDWVLHHPMSVEERIHNVRQLHGVLIQLPQLETNERNDMEELIVKSLGKYDEGIHSWLNEISAGVMSRAWTNAVLPKFCDEHDGALAASTPTNTPAARVCTIERLLLTSDPKVVEELQFVDSPACAVRQYFPYLFAVLPSKALHVSLNCYPQLNIKYLSWALSGQVQTAAVKALQRAGNTSVERMKSDELSDSLSEIILLVSHEHVSALNDSASDFLLAVTVCLKRRLELLDTTHPMEMSSALRQKKLKRLEEAVLEMVRSSPLNVNVAHPGLRGVFRELEFPLGIVEIRGIEETINESVHEGRVDKLLPLFQVPNAITESHWMLLFATSHSANSLLTAVYLCMTVVQQPKRVRLLLRRAFPYIDTPDLLDDQLKSVVSKLSALIGQ